MQASKQNLTLSLNKAASEAYLIITAAHNVQETPYERLYFFLPDEALQVIDSDIRVGSKDVRVRQRFELEQPHVLLADNEDLAAILLQEQVQDRGKSISIA